MLPTAPCSKLCTLPLHVLHPTLVSGARCRLGWAKHHSSDCARTKLRVWREGAALSLRPAQAMSFQCCISFLSLFFFLEHECPSVCLEGAEEGQGKGNGWHSSPSCPAGSPPDPRRAHLVQDVTLKSLLVFSCKLRKEDPTDFILGAM